ncbi:ash family protein [Klebsiella pneumoniae]|nr:ash family protein [Klebsiella pneumoniae]
MRCFLAVKLAAAAKSVAGRENPNPRRAQHAPACFFVHMPAHTRIMVAQAGQPKGWPVSFGPVFSPPSGLPPLRA